MERAVTSLEGKVALITGAGTGLGRSAALAFAQAGAVVAVLDLMPMNVDETVDLIVREGGAARGYVEDTTRGIAAGALVERVIEELGSIDILINAAEVRPKASILTFDEWDWHRTMDVNLTAPFLLIQAAARFMRDRDGGTVINMASCGREQPESGEIFAAYAAKNGLAALTRAIASELLTYNIHIHAIFVEKMAAIEGAALPWSVKDSDRSNNCIQLALSLCGPASNGLTGQVYTAYL
jgi:NAD(P)-dependent dehydrogenase (short-subunit alcohol dehydrogenase family)